MNAVVEKMLKEGKAVLLGEWRGYKPETIKYVSKKDGKPASFGRINHTIEIGDGGRTEAFTVSVPVEDGVDPSTVPVTFKKGSQVAVEVQSLVEEKGNKQVRGVVYSLAA